MVKASELVENGRRFAEVMLRDQEKILGAVYLHDRQVGVLAIPYKTSPDLEELERRTILAAIKVTRGDGNFDGLIMISEAWLSSVPVKHTAIAKVMRPSQDPNRQEVIILSAWGDDGAKHFMAIEIDRSNKKPRLGKVVTQSSDAGVDGVKSWIDEAFE